MSFITIVTITIVLLILLFYRVFITVIGMQFAIYDKLWQIMY